MPHSLRVRLKKLQRKGELTEKDIDRIFKALEQEPYICDSCKHKEDSWDTEPCDGCCGNHSGYAPTDAISREWLMRKATERFYITNYFNHISEMIEEAPSVTQKSGKWIPVSERLPEEFESVLVCYKSQGGMAQAVSERFGTHTGYRWSALAGIKPIAWMPLPEPYEPQEGSEE